MCGIISYIGKNKALPILISGLKSLEYRGYDSAGVAYLENNKIKTIKSVGKISKLEKLIDMNADSFMGIGHTRWATHGGVTKENSHPHSQGKITLVHNGIIENYLEIKEKLISNGYKFIGETDSEVLSGLIDYYYNETNDMIMTLEKVKNEVFGSYALGIIVSDDLNNLYAIRKDSPLIIGLSDTGNFIASDMPAIINYTNKYILLDEGEIAKITSDNVLIYNETSVVNKEIFTFDYDNCCNDLAGYDHYMLKEIYEEPSLIRNNLFENLDEIPDISKYRNVYIVGCGSAYHAGYVSKYLIEEYADIMVNIEIASEFRYKKLFLTNEDLVILISQSGETADTLASLRIAKKMGATTLGLVNVLGSSIAREADIVLYTNALTEVAVATTKAYMMQVYMLGLMAIKASKLNYNDYINDYKKLANQIDLVLNDKTYLEIAKRIYENDDIFFLGRGVDYALSMEGSLKLKEISYINSVAYPAGELKHGTISLIEDGTPVISVITSPKIKDKTISNIKEVISRGAKSYIITTDDLEIPDSYYDLIIKVPSNIDILKPILAVVSLQLLSYEVARLRGCDIDKPRNLAKSVTVE